MSTHTCATPTAFANLHRDGSPCNQRELITIIGGPLAMGAPGLPTSMVNDQADFIGFRFLDSDNHHAVQVWLACDDTFTIERCRDGQVLGVLTNIYLDQVNELAWQAACFRDTPFADHDPTTQDLTTTEADND